MKRAERRCKIFSENSKNEILEVSKGFLPDSTRIKFKDKIPRKERERIDKCLKQNKMRAIWTDTMVMIR